MLTAGDGVGTGKVFHYINGKFDVHQRVYRISDFSPYLDGRYLFYQFSTRFYDRIMSMTAKSSVDSVRMEMIAGMEIPLPTRAEQRAIATALSDVDALLEGLDRLIAKKRDLKQAAMQQLLTGQTRLPGFEGEWEVKRTSDLADVDPENLSRATNPNYRFNYISLEQVDEGQLLGVSEEVFHSSPSRARRALRHDDVLVSTVRPNLKSHLHFKSQVANAVCSTGFAVVRARPGFANPGFIYAHFFGDYVSSQIDKILSGSNYPAINSRDVWRIEFPCPPTVDEQSAIAGVLSDMDAEIDALEQRRTKTAALKQAMMQELLTGRTRLV